MTIIDGWFPLPPPPSTSAKSDDRTRSHVRDLLRGDNLAAVHLREPLRQRKADAQVRPPWARLDIASPCEQLEDATEERRGNAHTGVGHPNRREAYAGPRGPRRRQGLILPSASRRELRGVVVQIRGWTGTTRAGSTSTTHGCRADRRERDVRGPIAALGFHGACTSASASAVGRRFSTILPDVIRETSIRSSMRRTIWATWRSSSMRTRAEAVGGRIAPTTRISSRPVRMGASGFRSSWPARRQELVLARVGLAQPAARTRQRHLGAAPQPPQRQL